MDQFALAEGRALLGNPSDAAALEFTVSGGTFRSHGITVVATSGGRMRLRVNGAERPWRSTCVLDDGDVLEIGSCVEGVYGYLHLKGGIDSPTMLGSRSCHLPSGLGKFPAPGETLVPMDESTARKDQSLPRPEYFGSRTIRFMFGPQTRLFSSYDIESLTEGQFEVTGMRNRMGMRLECSRGRFDGEGGRTLASDAVVPGDMQVAGDGMAAVLLADAQPVGGYPRIGTVISADLHKLAQMPAGSRFELKRVERPDAIDALLQFRSRVADLERSIERTVRDPFEMKDLLSYTLVGGVVRGDEQFDD